MTFLLLRREPWKERSFAPSRMIVLAAIALFAAVVAAITRRWKTVLLAALLWPVYFVGLHQSWWGSGLGDGWAAAAIGALAATAVGATAGTWLGKRLAAPE